MIRHDALKDWYTQLPNDVRLDRKKLFHVFKKGWYRTIGSKAECYYTLEMCDHETPRMFLYRLNHVAKKAGIAFRKPTSAREAMSPTH